MPHKINRPLSKEDEQRIKKNIRYLKENLDQAQIRGYFMEEDIWDFPDFQEIDSGATDFKKNEIFIYLLLKSGPRAYKVFIKALKEHHSTHIIEKLESTEITDDTQGTSVDQLADLSESQKSHILTEHNLLKFNKIVGSDLEILGKALELRQPDIDNARTENPHSAITQIHKIILKWKNRNGKNATLGTFTHCLMNAEEAGANVDWDVFDKGVEAVTKPE
uniref:Death domain-containing protein CRADD-like n=1 Tax=Crassostrea virginica TaxID=6565 RepID=A0A8B8BE07_CRAVI|nr:death domain-containing protein CRADD-like [Crassostrea virginica]XP_022301226.1 death domain-containing protein CRADD-like [Crassostrea virginica]